MSGLHNGRYLVSEQDKEHFKQKGYVHLKAVIQEEELQDIIQPVYEAFLRGEIPVSGSDLCDMSGAKGRTPYEFTVYNVMKPRTYYKEWQGNLYEKRCKDIADQLQSTNDMEPDYDQILAKRPHSPDAIFAWHQDMAYWPPTAETATATCWLAISDATIENGCMRFVPGSHLEPQIRPHAPVGASREESHALHTVLREEDIVEHAPISRGDITVHNESVIHGSGPNLSDGWRHAYVLAFRRASAIREERAMGFTHSHNDETNWDVFRQHQRA
ncbi:PhyH-domain-containing protein [Coccomyxa subellipsoidea C-169]|uniref:PhyH-domain-containing protein n=1 Tax=Coccomyxa subellipsoidea (strain C-169) TaxID=574566 RepID=I0YTA7_COCSC|nr:PhyH-domain-containing protein [Coccomyxa subellipsoidea C-169]EIE21626.1 PhyH-domain-containing protein [Coccomyxa subellipsoidea C-169]|eukprot:XP_005646170.1 PhyH-domain-containing protein [Coccomyxa subellipsoidea C-169]